MLRVEPPPAEQKAPDPAPAVVAPVEEPPTSSASRAVPAAAPPAETEQVAALKPDETSPPETAKPDSAGSESPAPSEAAPAQTDAPAAADTAKIAAPDAETKTASTEQVVAAGARVLSPANDPPRCPAPTTSEQMSAPASPEADAASTKVATLGSPPVAVETPTVTAKADERQARPDVIKKRQQARRAAHRRRIAARARQAQLAAQQPTVDPFAQPYGSAAGGGTPLNSARGPVATGGPSGRPHSDHEPSYSALPRTPSR